jgi:WD40-like Beta Propeller Repeat
MNPDGGNKTCLTCSPSSELFNLHVGNPVWSPDGKFIVFQAQHPPSRGAAADAPDFPASGWNNDLWATDAHGKFWPLANVGGGSGGVICPTFSWDGKTLAWGQRLSTEPRPFGSWELAVGSFTRSGDGTPALSNIRYYTPGSNHYYYEPHSFSLDNQTLFFMGNLQPGMGKLAMDIYSFNLSTLQLTDLTNGPGDDWSEYPETMPSGKQLVYMSTKGNQPSSPGHAYCDLWSMNYDGSNKQRLTFFNDPSSPQYIPSGVCLDVHRWNADASQLVVYDNQVAANRFTRNRATGDIWIFNVSKSTR